ncbi:hypothetical protein JIN87_26415 [Pelagicoccus mobilis]|uniref:Uncharacterized protein n=1 Tax=Pelagicoccus mobilis TaxID=415221 RepID=A0A934VU68_9BACT|nr:hypothetical protein [Pelagicoccus mobilis]MBK1880448.1 hypothetical protein [Pelagicoccus mobilis]
MHLQRTLLLLALATLPFLAGHSHARERILINDGWRFMKYESLEDADDLIYDVRPEITDTKDDKDADTEPTDAVEINSNQDVLKPSIPQTTS